MLFSPLDFDFGSAFHVFKIFFLENSDKVEVLIEFGVKKINFGQNRPLKVYSNIKYDTAMLKKNSIS